MAVTAADGDVSSVDPGMRHHVAVLVPPQPEIHGVRYAGCDQLSPSGQGLGIAGGLPRRVSRGPPNGETDGNGTVGLAKSGGTVIWWTDLTVAEESANQGERRHDDEQSSGREKHPGNDQT